VTATGGSGAWLWAALCGSYVSMMLCGPDAMLRPFDFGGPPEDVFGRRINVEKNMLNAKSQ